MIPDTLGLSERTIGACVVYLGNGFSLQHLLYQAAQALMSSSAASRGFPTPVLLREAHYA